MAAILATFDPCGPFGWAQPRITSSISAGSSLGVFFRTSLIQWAARSSGRVILKDPRNDLARPVRELATMTASRIEFQDSKDPLHALIKTQYSAIQSTPRKCQ